MAVTAAGPFNIIDRSQAALLLYFPDVKDPRSAVLYRLDDSGEGG
jgi:hypothetical protein